MFVCVLADIYFTCGCMVANGGDAADNTVRF